MKEGTHYNLVEAEKWYRVGAEKGDIQDQRNLGKLLRDESHKWLTLAANSGDQEAVSILMQMSNHQ